MPQTLEKTQKRIEEDLTLLHELDLDAGDLIRIRVYRGLNSSYIYIPLPPQSATNLVNSIKGGERALTVVHPGDKRIVDDQNLNVAVLYSKDRYKRFLFLEINEIMCAIDEEVFIGSEKSVELTPLLRIDRPNFYKKGILLARIARSVFNQEEKEGKRGECHPGLIAKE